MVQRYENSRFHTNYSEEKSLAVTITFTIFAPENNNQLYETRKNFCSIIGNDNIR